MKASIPGETILETLQAKGWTQTQLARKMHRPIKTINELVKGKARITPETALQLEKHLKAPAHFWLALESNYRLQQARQAIAALEAVQD